MTFLFPESSPGSVDHIKVDRFPVTVESIVRAVCIEFRTTPQFIYGTDRRQPEARARQVAYWLIRKLTGKSYPKIGKIFKKDHTTVLHGVRLVDSIRTRNANFRNQTSLILSRLEDRDYE